MKAWKCNGCRRLWKKKSEAEDCCPPDIEEVTGDHIEECPDCKGTGEPAPGQVVSRDITWEEDECRRCSGTGVAYKKQAGGMAPGVVAK